MEIFNMKVILLIEYLKALEIILIGMIILYWQMEKWSKSWNRKIFRKIENIILANGNKDLRLEKEKLLDKQKY